MNNTTAETLLGDGGVSFFLKPPSFSLGNSPGAITAVDLNGDGTFQAPNNEPSVACYYNFSVVLTADFNRDGKPDVLTSCSGQISVF